MNNDHSKGTFKLCRFKTNDGVIRPGQIDAETGFVFDLGGAANSPLQKLLETPDPVAALSALNRAERERIPLAHVSLCSPVEKQEVWAAGVTYLRSKSARMDESQFSATAYDRVYAAERPELFFKALAEKVVGPGEPVGIRSDSRWSVPEPELALVINSRGVVVGQTIGLDMSARDIEGENLLYLPQAKIYERSCALGPVITIGASEEEVRSWRIQMRIDRGGDLVFQGESSVSQLKRSFGELVGYLFRGQRFPHGVVLLTGTGIVPPDSFTLHPGDVVTASISGIGTVTHLVQVI
jgi:2-dehydro-3-deoxy-D-arabinonate dehydratase